ncbi:MAG: hypothetical protein ABEH64_05105 [Salinirussus sp.]
MAESKLRDIICASAAIVLVLTGMLLTGVLPSGGRYQLVAGAVIVAGFAVAYGCLGGWEL